MDIYPYEDFRKYLQDAFAEKRKQEGRLTARLFAAAAGFSNPGFFNDVVKGTRTLSESATEKMIAAFGLKPNEAEYFKLLVEYGQSKRAE